MLYEFYLKDLFKRKKDLCFTEISAEMLIFFEKHIFKEIICKIILQMNFVDDILFVNTIR